MSAPKQRHCRRCGLPGHRRDTCPDTAAEQVIDANTKNELRHLHGLTAKQEHYIQITVGRAIYQIMRWRDYGYRKGPLPSLEEIIANCDPDGRPKLRVVK